MSQPPTLFNYPLYPNDWSVPGQSRPGIPFSLGAPIGVNAWSAPNFPQASASSSPHGLPPSGWPFAPRAAPQDSGSDASLLPNWWIASRSLLGAIPQQLDRPVGSDGLLGLLAFPDDWAIPAGPPRPNAGPAALTMPSNGLKAAGVNPPDTIGASTTAAPAPPTSDGPFGSGAPNGASGWGMPTLSASTARRLTRATGSATAQPRAFSFTSGSRAGGDADFG
jgi:hypothetical protein